MAQLDKLYVLTQATLSSIDILFLQSTAHIRASWELTLKNHLQDLQISLHITGNLLNILQDPATIPTTDIRKARALLLKKSDSPFRPSLACYGS